MQFKKQSGDNLSSVANANKMCDSYLKGHFNALKNSFCSSYLSLLWRYGSLLKICNSYENVHGVKLVLRKTSKNTTITAI